MKSHGMNRRAFLRAVGLAAGAAGASRWLSAAEPAAGPPAARPNIVFFLADDYGIESVGCYGSDRFKTPNLDALARTGLRFETAYCAPLCGPTRVEFNTGRYAFRTGGLTNASARSPSSRDEVGIARTLKAAGYATCHAGKWRQMGETPADWGFDEYLTDPTAGGYYWKKSYTKNGQLVETDKEIYYPDVMHDFAMDFVSRNRQGPFFLYYATHLVHNPILKTPDSAADAKDLYADNVAYLDKTLGKVVAELERLNLREKTLILFAADNGTAGRSGTIGGRQISGAKGSMWEGGARVPFIASWKGTAPQGKVLKDLVDFTDLYVTFAELAGAKRPEGVTLDGRSFTPQLMGRPGNPREWIFVQLGNQWYVREQGWKLNQRGDLFDMKDAPFEEKAVPADTQDPAAQEARKRLQAVLDRLNPAAGKTEPAGAAGEGKAARKAGKKQKVKA